MSPQPTKKNKSSIWSWVRFILLLGVIFFIFRFAIGVTVINGNSMNPTLNNGDTILSNYLLYEPERYDIVVIEDDAGFDIIKRVIALPNETIEIRDGKVLIDGKPLSESYTKGYSEDMPSMVVEDGTYFVIGDHRTIGESLDSRNEEVGSIPFDEIKGEAIFSLFPFGRIR